MTKKISDFYYINLDRRIDRKNNIENQIKSSKILKKELKRYPAIDGSQLYLNLIDENIVTEYGKKTIASKEILLYGVSLTYGSLGCAISHYNLFKKCAEKNNGNMLILEDDIIINKNIDYYINLINSISLEYDIFYLGIHKSSNTQKNMIDKNICELNGVFWGGFGYVVTPKVCKFIVEKIFPISKQFDSAINDRVRSKKIKALCFYSDVIKSGSFGTDNQGKNGLRTKIFDHNPWVKVFMDK
jgi:GR25 family glycosyltransferase involved in LPS biosynthesis